MRCGICKTAMPDYGTLAKHSCAVEIEKLKMEARRVIRAIEADPANAIQYARMLAPKVASD